VGGLDEEVHAKVTQKRLDLNCLEIASSHSFPNSQVWGFFVQTQYKNIFLELSDVEEVLFDS